jgi:hypothetical protein
VSNYALNYEPEKLPMNKPDTSSTNNSNNAITTLSVLFFAIALRDFSSGQLELWGVVLMGVITISFYAVPIIARRRKLSQRR